jgi:hypothetical protein
MPFFPNQKKLSTAPPSDLCREAKNLNGFTQLLLSLEEEKTSKNQ